MKCNNPGIGILRLANSLLELIFTLTIVVLISVGIYFLVDSFLINNSGESVEYVQYVPLEKEKKQDSFDSLRKINPDVVGWLYIDGTKINYPLLKGEDNYEYLFKDALGEYKSSGSLYLDYLNNGEFKDFNTIIYGHHMSSGNMFGDLDKFGDENFFKKHEYGKVYFRGKWHRLEFFAFLDNVDAYDEDIFCPGINKALNAGYVERLYEKALNKRNIEIGESDHLVLLSTCSYNITNGRCILAGKIMDGKCSKELTEKAEDRASNVQTILIYLEIAFAVLLIVLIILLILIYLKKKNNG